jgi:hypothetical protein
VPDPRAAANTIPFSWAQSTPLASGKPGRAAMRLRDSPSIISSVSLAVWARKTRPVFDMDIDVIEAARPVLWQGYVTATDETHRLSPP